MDYLLHTWLSNFNISLKSGYYIMITIGFNPHACVFLFQERPQELLFTLNVSIVFQIKNKINTALYNT